MPARRLETKKSCVKLTEKKASEDGERTVAQSGDKARSSSALSRSKASNNKQNLKDLLKQSYIFIRDENYSLNHKLKRKCRKVEELKEVIQDCDDRMKEYERTIASLRGSRPSSVKKNTGEKLQQSRHKYEEIVRQSQDIAKTSIEKYRKLEAKLEQQRLCYEEQISNLQKQNASLKSQLTKLRQGSTLQTTDRKKVKSYQKSDKKSTEVDMWGELKQLRQRRTVWQRKEEQMKRMLAEIAKKIGSLELKSRNSEQKIKAYEGKIGEMEKRYERRCLKQREGNQKWAGVFKDFCSEAQLLGNEIDKIKNIFYLILKREVKRAEKAD